MSAARPVPPRGPSKPPSPSSSVTRDVTHAPTTPSRLWQSHEPGSSPEDRRAAPPSRDATDDDEHYSPHAHPIHFETDGIHPRLSEAAPTAEDQKNTHVEAEIVEQDAFESHPDAHVRLLDSYNKHPACGHLDCEHGALSPRPRTHRSTMSWDDQYHFGGRPPANAEDGRAGNVGGIGAAISERLLNGGKRMSTTQWLAQRHGVKNQKQMYVMADLQS